MSENSGDFGPRRSRREQREADVQSGAVPVQSAGGDGPRRELRLQPSQFVEPEPAETSLQSRRSRRDHRDENVGPQSMETSGSYGGAPTADPRTSGPVPVAPARPQAGPVDAFDPRFSRPGAPAPSTTGQPGSVSPGSVPPASMPGAGRPVQDMPPSAFQPTAGHRAGGPTAFGGQAPQPFADTPSTGGAPFSASPTPPAPRPATAFGATPFTDAAAAGGPPPVHPTTMPASLSPQSRSQIAPDQHLASPSAQMPQPPATRSRREMRAPEPPIADDLSRPQAVVRPPTQTGSIRVVSPTGALSAPQSTDAVPERFDPPSSASGPMPLGGVQQPSRRSAHAAGPGPAPAEFSPGGPSPTSIASSVGGPRQGSALDAPSSPAAFPPVTEPGPVPGQPRVGAARDRSRAEAVPTAMDRPAAIAPVPPSVSPAGAAGVPGAVGAGQPPSIAPVAAERAGAADEPSWSALTTSSPRPAAKEPAPTVGSRSESAGKEQPIKRRWWVVVLRILILLIVAVVLGALVWKLLDPDGGIGALAATLPGLLPPPNL